jgi:hypothetical protein
MTAAMYYVPGTKFSTAVVQIDEKCRVRFCSPDPGLDLVIFTEYIFVEVYNQTPKNKLEKYLISGRTGWKSTSADFLLF